MTDYKVEKTGRTYLIRELKTGFAVVKYKSKESAYPGAFFIKPSVKIISINIRVLIKNNHDWETILQGAIKVSKRC